jgi:hypothetical protein
MAGLAAGVLALGLVAPTGASATHGVVSLPGSNFEIDVDANLKVDDTGWDDWASVSEIRKADQPTGTSDNSFGQGTKEDTAVPTVVSGSIPPNKSDLLNFGVYLEDTGADRFLHMFWHRVQEPNGTTNMDFEFNQSEALSSNNVTPVRTSGDALIQYDLAQGGTNPQLFVSFWIDGTEGATAADCEASNSLPCWAERDNLTSAGDATGSINTSAIPAAEADGLGNISPRTFGEATVDFDAISGGDECSGFGSAYLKSRASDSFTAALKDFIAPEETDFDNCGAIQVTKTAKHFDTSGDTSADLEATFSVKDSNDVEVGTITTDAATGIGCLDALPLGDYTVEETAGPAGYLLDDSVESVTVDTAGTCSEGYESVSFENKPLSNITVSFESQVAGGTAATIDCVDGASAALTANPADSTPSAFDDSSETFEDLVEGTYVCTVVVDP